MRIIFDIFVVVLCATLVNGNSPLSNSIGVVIKGDAEEKNSKKASGPIGTSGLSPPGPAATSLSSFSSSAKAEKVAEGLAKKETEKNLLKKLIREDDSKRDNFGHNKSNKIKIASSKVTPTLTKADLNDEDDDEDDDEAGGDAKKNVVEKNEQTSAITKQIMMGLTYMAVSRFVMKLDFTNAKTLQLCRGIFAVYLLGSQLLFYFVKQRIEELNDQTLLDAEQPFSLKGLQDKIPMLSNLGKTVMLCYVMLCYVMLCYVMLYYVILCYVMLCYVMLCHVMSCYVMLCYVL